MSLRHQWTECDVQCVVVSIDRNSFLPASSGRRKGRKEGKGRAAACPTNQKIVPALLETPKLNNTDIRQCLLAKVMFTDTADRQMRATSSDQ